MTLTMEASQMVLAACSPHRLRAWASDWRTGIVVMPVPPPSAMSTGSEGSGARLPISSRASRSGRVESRAGRCGGKAAGGLGEVFDEGGDQGPGGAGAGAGGEQVERAVVGEELLGVELLAGRRG